MASEYDGGLLITTETVDESIVTATAGPEIVPEDGGMVIASETVRISASCALS
jgi:hypothetical protein